MTLGPAIFDRHVPTLDITGLAQALVKCAQPACPQIRRLAADVSDHRHCGLLRARRERPRRRAADQRDELAAFHSITSSASSRRSRGIVNPSVLSVLRLIASSNLVGCSIGMSPGLAPLRILPTNTAACLNSAGRSVS